MNDRERSELIKWYEDYAGENRDLWDIQANIDTNLTKEENMTIIKEEFDSLFPRDLTKSEIKNMEERNTNLQAEHIEKTYEQLTEEETITNWKSILKDIKSISIAGETGTGKTALSFYLLDLFKKHTKKKVYAYKFPRPDLLRSLGIEIMYSIEELSVIENAVVYLPEPQLVMPRQDKKNNDVLQKILSLARQRDIVIILDTSDTGYINRGLESYINVWCVKDIAYSLIKHGSIIKHIIRDNSIIDPDTFRLKNNEYLFYSRQFYKINGKKNFTKPDFFNDKFSKAFRSAN